LQGGFGWPGRQVETVSTGASAVRPIRDEIEARVLALLAELEVPLLSS
jgi:hypothetical protein